MKKIIIGGVIALLIGIGVYFYAYQSHRDIATEKADAVITVSQLLEQFKQNDSLANATYLDKNLELKGKVTQVDLTTNTIMIDAKLTALLSLDNKIQVKENDIITVKGRFLGYDDLLEELKLDQATIKN